MKKIINFAINKSRLTKMITIIRFFDPSQYKVFGKKKKKSGLSEEKIKREPQKHYGLK